MHHTVGGADRVTSMPYALSKVGEIAFSFIFITVSAIGYMECRKTTHTFFVSIFYNKINKKITRQEISCFGA